MGCSRHYIKICKNCGDVIEECKCEILDKEEIYTVCNSCRKGKRKGKRNKYDEYDEYTSY